MKIKLSHPEYGTICSDDYPDTEEVRDNAAETLDHCLLGKQSYITIKVNGDLMLIPANVLKQSVISFVK